MVRNVDRKQRTALVDVDDDSDVDVEVLRMDGVKLGAFLFDVGEDVRVVQPHLLVTLVSVDRRAKIPLHTFRTLKRR